MFGNPTASSSGSRGRLRAALLPSGSWEQLSLCEASQPRGERGLVDVESLEPWVLARGAVSSVFPMEATPAEWNGNGASRCVTVPRCGGVTV